MNRSPMDFDESRPVVRADSRPLVRVNGTYLTFADLLRRGQALAACLPDGPAAMNLCERRENYLVALLALEYRNQVCLMAPSRAPTVLQDVEAAYPGSFRINDSLVDDAVKSTCESAVVPRELDPRRITAIGYTSGSTGKPKPTPKSWRALAGPARHNALCLQRELPGDATLQPWIVATVPSQHMYGMELTAILPLLSGIGIHASHPLFPADIATALADVPAPRVLVSTPVHLRALLKSGVVLPKLAAVVSATAPLAVELAEQIETQFTTHLVEYFGSTETCVIASRRTALGAGWAPYPGLRLLRTPEGTVVEAPWLDVPVVMQDEVVTDPDGRFRVTGRSADMIEVAGKRMSLADLTGRLLAVPGVADAVVLQPAEATGARARRLVAFVVSTGVSPKAIAAALAGQIDAAFIPRPIVCVDRLPRNDVGKLPRDELLRLARENAFNSGEKRN